MRNYGRGLQRRPVKTVLTVVIINRTVHRAAVNARGRREVVKNLHVTDSLTTRSSVTGNGVGGGELWRFQDARAAFFTANLSIQSRPERVRGPEKNNSRLFYR